MGLYIGCCLLLLLMFTALPILLERLRCSAPESLTVRPLTVCAQAHDNHHSLLTEAASLSAQCYGHAHAAPAFPVCFHRNCYTHHNDNHIVRSSYVTFSELTLQLLTTTALCFPTGRDSFTGRDLGGTVYRSGMCLLCYQEYLEVGGGQVQGHNPPAFTRGLIKTAKAAEVRAACSCSHHSGSM